MSATSYPRNHKPGLGPFLLRWLRRIFVSLLAAAVCAYVIDFAQFMLRGQPHGFVTINHMLAAPLKGNKTEYYYEGSEPVACAEALYPHAGWQPCWYLRRHTIVAEDIQGSVADPKSGLRYASGVGLPIRFFRF